MRTCARPSCSQPASATLRFAYGSREAVIDPLDADEPPQTYDLCGIHAARTRPPHGWTLRDHRLLEASVAGGGEAPPTSPPASPPTGIGGSDTVALLAAALHAAADRSAGGSSTGSRIAP